MQPDDDIDLEDEVAEEETPKPTFESRYRRSNCPKSNEGHKPVPNKKRRPYDPDYICAYCGKTKWTPMEIEELITNTLLREDSNRELCRQCKEEYKDSDPDYLPYGHETGQVEWELQKDGDGNAALDAEGNVMYVAYPELRCENGHRWYKGEGPRRDIRGPNPILFESHLYNRRRREIQTEEGTPDPAYTMDRWGKRPTPGLYIRVHPQGRKVNSDDARKNSGAAFYR